MLFCAVPTELAVKNGKQLKGNLLILRIPATWFANGEKAKTAEQTAAGAGLRKKSIVAMDLRADKPVNQRLIALAANLAN